MTNVSYGNSSTINNNMFGESDQTNVHTVPFLRRLPLAYGHLFELVYFPKDGRKTLDSHEEGCRGGRTVDTAPSR